MRPTVAVVGRPNVGKSTLFNRLTRRRRAIVADEPGVTRDRLYLDADFSGGRLDVPVVLVDTGGFDPNNVDPIMRRVLDQTQFAIDEADAVIFVVDGRTGVLPEDRDVANLLRRGNKPVVVAVNKMDGEKQDGLAGEFYSLGMEHLVPISAAHARGMASLEETVVELLGTQGLLPEVIEPPKKDESTIWAREDESEDPPEESEDKRSASEDDLSAPIRVAVIGRPNVGKSSLVNRLLGEDRHLVSDMAGTTRDVVDSLITRGGRDYLFIDTAGIRRKRSIAMRVEKFSVIKALQGVERSDVALLLLDATQPIAEQDARVSSFAYERGRAVVLVVSKWDAQEESSMKAHTAKIRQELPHLAYAPIVYTSSFTGFGLDRLFTVVQEVREQHGLRITTGELNRFVDDLMDRHPPPTRRGRRARIYYMTQIGTRPPRFLVSVNDPQLIHFSYRRYLVNEIRKAYGYQGVPLLLGYRARSKRANGLNSTGG